MSDSNDEWLVAYKALDSATLLALLPVLRREMDRVENEVKHVRRSQETSGESEAQIAELFNEALVAFDARVSSDEDGRADFEAFRGTVRSYLRAYHRSTEGHRDSTANFESRLAKHHWDHVRRERWILEELARRGLLPAIPRQA